MSAGMQVSSLRFHVWQTRGSTDLQLLCRRHSMTPSLIHYTSSASWCTPGAKDAPGARRLQRAHSALQRAPHAQPHAAAPLQAHAGVQRQAPAHAARQVLEEEAARQQLWRPP